MSAKIMDVKAKEIFAQRGLLSLHVTVTADDGAVGVSTPESGVSTGTHEMKFLLDGGERYAGLGVRQAAEQINTVIAPALKGMDVTAQGEIDPAAPGLGHDVPHPLARRPVSRRGFRRACHCDQGTGH